MRFFRFILEGLILLMFMKAASFWLLLEALKKKVLTEILPNRDKSIILTEGNTNQVFLGDAYIHCSRLPLFVVLKLLPQMLMNLATK